MNVLSLTPLRKPLFRFLSALEDFSALRFLSLLRKVTFDVESAPFPHAAKASATFVDCRGDPAWSPGRGIEWRADTQVPMAGGHAGPNGGRTRRSAPTV